MSYIRSHKETYGLILMGFIGDNNTSYYEGSIFKKALVAIDSRILYPIVRKNALRSRLKKFDRLNIGCGDVFAYGWLNIGLSKDYSYGKLYDLDGKTLLNFDMSKELPFRKDSIKYIYSSHFLEHITFSEGIALLDRCHRIMEKGGIIRLTFPDMELWIKNYYEKNDAFFDKYRRLALGGKRSSAITRGEIFMSQVHGWGHRWNYDFESIKHILEDAGFRHVIRKKAFESSIPDIGTIEPHDESRLMETIYVEATK